MTEKLQITNPRRILLVGTSGSGKLTFLQALTGSLPIALPSSPSHAGLSHELALTTQYYDATIPIWIDEIPSDAQNPSAPTDTTTTTTTTSDSDPDAEPPTLATWSASYLSAPATPVLSALGGLVLTFRTPSPPAAQLAALERIARACDDCLCLAVAVAAVDGAEAAEETCMRYGFELVEMARAGGRNEFGEKVGMERVREALEAGDWMGDGEEAEDRDEGDEDEDEVGGLEKGLEKEMREALLREEDGETGGDNDDEEEQVEKLEAAMMQLQMLKDMGDDVSKEERRRIATKALSQLMKP